MRGGKAGRRGGGEAPAAKELRRNGHVNATTGVEQLDNLLGGGLRDGERILVYGPSFRGKEVLARQAMVANMKRDIPVVAILTNETVDDVRQSLRRMDARYDTYEADGLAWFIDAYSRSIGVQHSQPCVQYVDSATDLDRLGLALDRIHAQVVKRNDAHLMVLDSASTLVLYSNAQATFRFLEVIIGRARQAGAVSMVLLDHGMHSENEVQVFRDLVDGVLEARDDEDRPQLRVEGLQVVRSPGWTDYEFSDDRFELTGSLAAGKVQ